jgi:hypothetical protein
MSSGAVAEVPLAGLSFHRHQAVAVDFLVDARLGCYTTGLHTYLRTLSILFSRKTADGGHQVVDDAR